MNTIPEFKSDKSAVEAQTKVKYLWLLFCSDVNPIAWMFSLIFDSQNAYWPSTPWSSLHICFLRSSHSKTWKHKAYLNPWGERSNVAGGLQRYDLWCSFAESTVNRGGTDRSLGLENVCKEHKERNGKIPEGIACPFVWTFWMLKCSDSPPSLLFLFIKPDCTVLVQIGTSLIFARCQLFQAFRYNQISQLVPAPADWTNKRLLCQSGKGTVKAACRLNKAVYSVPR